ncbi:MAG: hypothetical protein ABIO79_04970 [Ferruginibacter sp.]
MKNKLSKLLLLAVIFFAAAFSASAQIYVQIRPTLPVIVRPPQPSPVYIWVNEEWEPNGNSYKYSGGHWEAPRQGYYRKPGYWVRTKQGNKWVKGNWAKPGNNGNKYGHKKYKKHKKH